MAHRTARRTMEGALAHLHPRRGRHPGTSTLLYARSSKMPKWRAEQELRALVDAAMAETGGYGDSTATFGWWWTNKYLPLRKDTWSRAWTSTLRLDLLRIISSRGGAEVPVAEIDGQAVAQVARRDCRTSTRRTSFKRACQPDERRPARRRSTRTTCARIRSGACGCRGRDSPSVRSSRWTRSER